MITNRTGAETANGTKYKRKARALPATGLAPGLAGDEGGGGRLFRDCTLPLGIAGASIPRRRKHKHELTS